MNTIAQAIIANAKNNHSILCWDGSNSKADLIENIRHYVSNFTGWKELSVTFEKNVLEIWARASSGDTSFLLAYNVSTYREVYGRLRDVGFYWANIDELETLMTAQ